MKKLAIVGFGLVMMMSSATPVSATVNPAPPAISWLNQLNAVVMVLDVIRNRLKAILFPDNPEDIPAPNGAAGQISAIHRQLVGVSSVLNEEPSAGGEETETILRIRRQAGEVVYSIGDHLKQGQLPDNIRLALESASAAAQDIVDLCDELLTQDPAPPEPDRPGPYGNFLNAVAKELGAVGARLHSLLESDQVPSGSFAGKLKAIADQLEQIRNRIAVEPPPSPAPGPEEVETIEVVQTEAMVIVSTVEAYLKQGPLPDKIRIALESASAAAQDIVDRCEKILSPNPIP